MVFSMVSSRDDIPVACQYPKSRSTHRMSGGRDTPSCASAESRLASDSGRLPRNHDRLRQQTAAIRSYRRVHSCQINDGVQRAGAKDLDVAKPPDSPAPSATHCSALFFVSQCRFHLTRPFLDTLPSFLSVAMFDSQSTYIVVAFQRSVADKWHVLFSTILGQRPSISS